MERSASTIGRTKFTAMSGQRQHKLLAELARAFVGSDDFATFHKRYEEFHGWAALDRYKPPTWLTTEEALLACEAFHLERAGSSVKTIPPRMQSLPWQPRFPVQIALDHVRTPHNLGSVLRLADNFGFAGIIQGRPWHDRNHPRLRRSARGCENWIPLNQVDDLYQTLAKADIPIIALETGDQAISIQDWRPPHTCILLLGNETHGIAQSLLDLCSQRVEIPMFGYKKSMNVHQALAIAGFTYLQHHL